MCTVKILPSSGLLSTVRSLGGTGLGLDMLHDGESQSCTSQAAAPCLVDAVETFEYTRQMFLGYALSPVLDLDDQRTFFLSGRNTNLTVFLTVLHGVVEQVDDCLFEQGRIDPGP